MLTVNPAGAIDFMLTVNPAGFVSSKPPGTGFASEKLLRKTLFRSDIYSGILSYLPGSQTQTQPIFRPQHPKRPTAPRHCGPR